MNTSSMYKWVVDDVISKMRPETVQEGVDECVRGVRAPISTIAQHAGPAVLMSTAGA